MSDNQSILETFKVLGTIVSEIDSIDHDELYTIDHEFTKFFLPKAERFIGSNLIDQ